MRLSKSLSNRASEQRLDLYDRLELGPEWASLSLIGAKLPIQGV
jgi:hypothetical protein